MNIGLVGVGNMGRGHLDQYLRLAREDSDIRLTAIADIDPEKFKGVRVQGNLGSLGASGYDFSPYHCYTSAEEMFAREPLDAADIVAPTYAHADLAIKAMEAGLHVLCEKPMALRFEDCDRMIEASKRTGKKLMVAQVLRYWRAYEILKEYVDGGALGRPVFFSMFRGGGTPQWSYEGWLLDETRSGGCLLDQHIHDIDALNWLFGRPEAVSCVGRRLIPGAGFDAVSTHYRYPGMVAQAADDWTMNNRDVSFSMWYRASFERGMIEFKDGVTRVWPNEGEAFVADDGTGPGGYYREICYFAHELIPGKADERSSLASTRVTMAMARAEHRSAELGGEWVAVEE